MLLAQSGSCKPSTSSPNAMLIDGMAGDVQLEGPAEPSEFTRHAEIAHKVLPECGAG